MSSFDDEDVEAEDIPLNMVALNAEAGRPLLATYTIEYGDQLQFTEALLDYLRGGQSNPEVVFDEGDFWRWDGLRWRVIDRMDVQRTLLHASEWAQWDTGPIRINRATINSVLELAEIEAGSGRAGFFAGAAAGVSFLNGFAVVSGDGVRLIGNHPELKARHVHRYDFDPDAECPRFHAFLDGLFEPDEDSEEKKRLLAQFIGVCLVGEATAYQRALMLSGSGSNGKSTLVNIIEAMFPPGSMSAVSPQEMSSQESVSGLVGALLNLVSDIPIRDLKDTGGFKQIVTGDAVAGRRLYENSFRFRPKAGHIFSCNTLPTADDMTHGFFRRWIVLTFNREFRPEEQVPPSELVPALLEEMPGIMAWALRGASEVMAAKRFFIPASSEEALGEWRQTGDQVQAFLDDCTIRIQSFPDPARFPLYAKQLYKLYEQWAKDCGVGRLSQQKLLRRVRDDHKVHTRRTGQGVEYALEKKPSFEMDK